MSNNKQELYHLVNKVLGMIPNEETSIEKEQQFKELNSLYERLALSPTELTSEQAKQMFIDEVNKLKK